MSLVSIRLTEDLEEQLAREAERSQRPKSEVVRDAIADYLQRLERERFLAEIARAARERGSDEALTAAEEALPLDNEALAILEGVREPQMKYRARNANRRRGKKKR